MMKNKLFLSMLVLTAAGTATLSAQEILDKRDLTVKEWNTDASTNFKFLDHVTIYNSSGQKIEEKEYTSKGIKWTRIYEYDAAGKVTRELTYNEKGKLDNIRKYTYNKFGKKSTEQLLDAKGRLVKLKEYEYITTASSD